MLKPLPSSTLFKSLSDESSSLPQKQMDKAITPDIPNIQLLLSEDSERDTELVVVKSSSKTRKKVVSKLGSFIEGYLDVKSKGKTKEKKIAKVTTNLRKLIELRIKKHGLLTSPGDDYKDNKRPKLAEFHEDLNLQCSPLKKTSVDITYSSAEESSEESLVALPGSMGVLATRRVCKALGLIIKRKRSTEKTQVNIPKFQSSEGEETVSPSCIPPEVL